MVFGGTKTTLQAMRKRKFVIFIQKMTASTTNDTPQLTLPYESFKLEIEKFMEEGSVLHKSDIKTEDHLIQLQEQTKKWEKTVLEFLKTAFTSANNYWEQGFYRAYAQTYNIPGMQRVLKNEIEKQKLTIGNKHDFLFYNLRLLSVSDAILLPKGVDLSERANFKIEDTLTLLLDKLYELYDDNYYPVKEILVRNGIHLKRQNEEYDLAKMLEDRDWIELQNYGGLKVRLTNEGVLFVDKEKKNILKSKKWILKIKGQIFLSHMVEVICGKMWQDLLRRSLA